jgi:hypothetical protein
MDASDTRTTRSALWCGVLEADHRPLAPESDVRTVRGLYTAARAPRRKRGKSIPAPVGRPLPEE